MPFEPANIFDKGLEHRVERDEDLIRALEARIALLEEQLTALKQAVARQQGEIGKFMGTTNDALAKLTSDVTAETDAVQQLATQQTAATTAITNAINDLKAAINSQPQIAAQLQPLLATIEANNSKINDAATALQTLGSTATAADPGAQGGTTVNS